MEAIYAVLKGRNFHQAKTNSSLCFFAPTSAHALASSTIRIPELKSGCRNERFGPLSMRISRIVIPFASVVGMHWLTARRVSRHGHDRATLISSVIGVKHMATSGLFGQLLGNFTLKRDFMVAGVTLTNSHESPSITVYASRGPISWPSLRRSAWAPAIKAVRGTGSGLRQLKGRSVPPSVPLRGHPFPLSYGPLYLFNCRWLLNVLVPGCPYEYRIPARLSISDIIPSWKMFREQLRQNTCRLSPEDAPANL